MTTNSTGSSSPPDVERQPSGLIAVDVRRFPGIRRLTADYAYNFSAVAPFFAGDPTERAAWQERIRAIQAHFHQHADIAAILARQQERRGAPPPARAAAARLADPSCVAIVTGQQAGLFGGPLFTLLKALTALKLAERASHDHGVPTVAVFWIDAEDHDWDEVRSCTVFDQALAPHAVSLPARSGADQRPVASIRLDSSVSEALVELERVLPPTEFRPGLMADLRSAYTPNIGMAEAFGRWMERLLGPRGLVVFDSSDPAAKPIAARVFAGELASPGETARLAAAAGLALVARGYHAQVQPHDDGLALFLMESERRAIRRHDGEYVIGDERYQVDRLTQLAGERPEAFSPNVLLRPIVQDTLFPTICYVAGPNELAYLGQLRRVYDRFSVPMPLMYPRESATILDAAALRFLEKYQLPLETLQPQDDSALNRLLASQIPPAVEESFTRASATIADRMTALIQGLRALDPTLEGAAKSTIARMQHDLDTLRGKMIQAAKRRDETLRRQFTRARALAFPGGHPQERSIGFIWFLNQYGDALLDRLDLRLPLDVGHHWVVAI